MAKRFTDTDLWQKEWFLRLPDLQRSLFLYIKDNCDCCGVYEANYMLLSFIFRKEITKEDILAINETKTQIEFLNTNKFFLIDFCSFQYGELKPSCKPHLKVIETLKKHSLFERVCKPFTKGINTLEEKEKEKEEEKDKEKEQLKEEEKKENQVKEKKENDKPINEEMRKRLEEMLREQNKRQEEYIESG